MPPPSSPVLPVSVIIPAFDRAAVLPRALASIAAQGRPPAEVLVVDDCSSDGTAAVAERLGARVLRHDHNQGAGGARNTALRAATQEWVAFLDSDDEWLPGHLDRVWERRADHVLVCDSAMSTGFATGERVLGHPAPEPVVLRSPAELLFPANPLPTSGILARRDVLLDVGAFRTAPPGPGMGRWLRAQDLDLWLRAAERGTVLACPEVGYRYHMTEGQTTGDADAMRSHVLAIAETFAERPWCTPALLEQVRVVATWDELQAARRAGRRAEAARKALWLTAAPRRLDALRRLLTWRAGLRRRAPAAAAGAPAAPAVASAPSERAALRADVARYGEAAWMREQSLYAVALYRLARAADARGGVVAKVADRLYWPLMRVMELVTGISLPKTAEVGPGLRIWHFGGIMVHGDVRIGRDCTLRQGVTIGNRVAGGPVPVLGDDVEVGAYAQILGGIHVGDGAKIGAMSVVLQDVPAGATAIGIPARIRHGAGT